MADSDFDLVPVSGVCEIHGPWENKVFKALADMGYNSFCPTCKKEREAIAEQERAEKLSAAAEASRVAHLNDCGVSDRHLGKTFDRYAAETSEQRDALSACADLAESVAAGKRNVPSLILCGNPGTGKTHLGAAIVQHVIASKKTALRATVLQIIRDVKASWAKKAKYSEEEILSYYAGKDVLVIDEVGVQFGSDTERMYLFEIIDLRYEACLPTVLISNLDLSRMTAEVGERVIDRLREDGGRLLTFTGESWRKR